MPAENLPTVDVVIPCYNYAHYLERCIQSVIQQENVIIRALIVDDCSPDNTEEVGRRLAAEHPQVEYIRNETNKGLVGTSNVGLMGWATAKYSIWLSADDLLCEGAVSRAARIMDAHPNVGMVYGLARVFSDDSDIKEERLPDPVEYQVIPGYAYIDRCCDSWCPTASPSAMVRTSVQQQLGGLDPNLPATCDVEIWMRISTVADVGVLNTVQAFYRRHESNMSSGFTYRPLSDLREQYEALSIILNVHGANLPKAAEWKKVSTDRLLEESAWLAGMALERGDDKGVEICTDFAKEISPDWQKAQAWKRFEIKRKLGKRVLTGLRKLTGKQRKLEPHNPFNPGETFGWLPDPKIAERQVL